MQDTSGKRCMALRQIKHLHDSEFAIHYALKCIPELCRMVNKVLIYETLNLS